MSKMFQARCSPPPAPPICTHLTPHHALVATRQAADSLSAANKLLIRCAWAGTPAFARAGYDSSWAPGSCP